MFRYKSLRRHISHPCSTIEFLRWPIKSLKDMDTICISLSNSSHKVMPAALSCYCLAYWFLILLSFLSDTSEAKPEDRRSEVSFDLKFPIAFF